MSRKLIFGIVLFAFKLSLAAADLTAPSRFSDIDAKEVAETPIAKRLVQAGFVEEPKGSGRYRAKMPWAKIKELLEVKEGDLRPIPSGPAGAWQHHVDIDGGFAYLSKDGSPWEPNPTDPLKVGEIEVVANLGYARPATLRLRMRIDQMNAALKFLGATDAPLAPAEVLPADSVTDDIRVTPVILPDGVPIVAAWKIEERDIRSRPSVPHVFALYVGSGTNGFADWNPKTAKKVESIAIAKYRAGKVVAAKEKQPPKH